MKNTSTTIQKEPYITKTKIGKTEFIIHSFFNAEGKELEKLLKGLIIYKATQN